MIFDAQSKNVSKECIIDVDGVLYPIPARQVAAKTRAGEEIAEECDGMQ